MKYDETELIEFFGILSSEQNPEEKEFFNATIFDHRQNRYHLSVSFSIYRNEFYLDLKDTELEEPQTNRPLICRRHLLHAEQSCHAFVRAVNYRTTHHADRSAPQYSFFSPSADSLPGF